MSETHEPDLDRLAALVDGRLAEGERRDVLAHLADCGACREIVGAIAPGRARSARRPARWILPLAASIAIAIAVGGGVLFRASLERRAGPESAEETLRGGGERAIAGKTLRLVAGTWVDAAYDPAALLPVTVVAAGPALDAAVAREPALAPFARLHPPVVVVLHGRVWRIEPVAPSPRP